MYYYVGQRKDHIHLSNKLKLTTKRGNQNWNLFANNHLPFTYCYVPAAI